MYMDFLRYFTDFYINLARGYSYPITEVFMYLGIVALFFKKKKRKIDYLWYLLDIACVWLSGIILASFIYWATSFTEAYTIEIILPILIVAYAFIRGRCPIVLRLIYGFIYYAVVSSSLVISSYFGSLIFAAGVSISTFPLTLVIQILLIILTVLIIKIPKLEEFDQINVVYSYVVLLIPVIHLVVIYVVKFIDGAASLQKTIYNLAFVVLEYIAYIFYYFIMKEHSNNYELQAVAIKKQQDSALAHMAKDNAAMLSKVRHDMKNHLAYMGSLLKESKYDELNTYFTQYSTEIYDAVKFSNCGNSSVDYILNIEIQKAKRHDVSLTYLVSVAPTLPIKNTDLTSLLMNALDNAIEAAGNSEEKKVSFSMKQEGMSILIKITNSVKEESKINFKKTSKSSSLGHGYGIKIMKDIAEKYGGAFDIKKDSSSNVTLSCMLSLYKEDEENGK